MLWSEKLSESFSKAVLSEFPMFSDLWLKEDISRLAASDVLFASAIQAHLRTQQFQITPEDVRPHLYPENEKAI